MLVSVGHPQKVFAQNGTTPPDEKAEVMILGTSHFDNPGQDVINVTFPDVLKPKYQRQIARVIDSLSTFEPTKVAIEARESFEADVDSMYQRYRKGNHELTRNERQQLGFRLGKRFNHSQLYAIDHDGKFPFREVLAYAKKHNTEFVEYFKKTRKMYQAFA
ncbi:MAG: DUF5694 domain-containing protein [Balneolaceae bacterium]|nr:DUF5694 domain-containing protein [Balneolaceae bacterium]